MDVHKIESHKIAKSIFHFRRTTFVLFLEWYDWKDSSQMTSVTPRL